MNCKKCGKTRTQQEQRIFNGICFGCAPGENVHQAYVTALELAQDIEDRDELISTLELMADKTNPQDLETRTSELERGLEESLGRIRKLEEITERQLERTIRMLNTLEAKE